MSSSASLAYWSRMWLSWPSSRAELVVGQAEAGEVGDVLDVVAGQGGHDPMIAARPGPGRSGSRSNVCPQDDGTTTRRANRGWLGCSPAGILPLMHWKANVRKVLPRRHVDEPVAPVVVVEPAPATVAPLLDEVRLDVELTIPRARLDGFAAALVGEEGLGVGAVSPDRLTKAFNGAIDRAGGHGSASVSRSPAGVYTPEYWRFRIESADSIAQGVLARAGRSARTA